MQHAVLSTTLWAFCTETGSESDRGCCADVVMSRCWRLVADVIIGGLGSAYSAAKTGPHSIRPPI